jgi:hypothetical protein
MKAITNIPVAQALAEHAGVVDGLSERVQLDILAETGP